MAPPGFSALVLLTAFCHCVTSSGELLKKSQACGIRSSLYLKLSSQRVLPRRSHSIPYHKDCPQSPNRLPTQNYELSHVFKPLVLEVSSMGFPRKNTGVGCHFLLQGILLTQGSNSGLLRLLYCRQILYPLNHQGSP